MTVNEQIKKLLGDVSGKTDIDVSEKTKIKSLGLSSLGLIELVVAVEDTFGISVPNSALKKIKTVGDMCDIIRKLTGEK